MPKQLLSLIRVHLSRASTAVNPKQVMVWIFLGLVVGLVLNTSSARANGFGDFFRSEAATLLLMKDLGLDTHPDADELGRTITSTGDSDLVDVDLKQSQVGEIHILAKGPHGFASSGARFTTMLIVSGVFTGRDSIALLAQLPGVVVVGIDYPSSIPVIAHDPELAFQFLRKTPGSIALSLRWLSRQSWVESQGPSAMGISLGGLFLPVALRMTEHLGVNVPRSIFAFTGADLVTVAAANLKGAVSDDVRGPLLNLIATLTALDDPRMHLPFITGNHLVVRADQDQTIPPSATDDLYRLLQNPKQSVTLHGGHINTNTPVLIQQTEDAIVQWMGLKF